jgi:hypothetical protein
MIKEVYDRELSDRTLSKHVEDWQWEEAERYNQQQVDSDGSDD